jgi:hypothetical protein
MWVASWEDGLVVEQRLYFFHYYFSYFVTALWTRLKGGPCLITVGTVVTVIKPLEWKTNWTIQIPFHLVISS